MRPIAETAESASSEAGSTPVPDADLILEDWKAEQKRLLTPYKPV